MDAVWWQIRKKKGSNRQKGNLLGANGMIGRSMGRGTENHNGHRRLADRATRVDNAGTDIAMK